MVARFMALTFLFVARISQYLLAAQKKQVKDHTAANIKERFILMNPPVLLLLTSVFTGGYVSLTPERI